MVSTRRSSHGRRLTDLAALRPSSPSPSSALLAETSGASGTWDAEPRLVPRPVGEDLEEEFRRLSREVSAFSKEVRSRLDPSPLAAAERMAEQNVHLARTMFGKWSLEILSALYAARSIGFEELRRPLPGITSSVLSYRLQRMEAHGLVDREVLATRPVRVRYRLTPKGLTVAILGEPVFLFLRYMGMREKRMLSAHPRPR